MTQASEELSECNVHQLRPKQEPLKCNGVGRAAEHERCIVVYFNRRLTDDEMRFFHECSARTAALMPE